MTILKKLMIVTALLAGGSSLAMAQYGGPTGGNRLVTAPSGMPAYSLAAPGPGYVTSGTAHHGPTGYGGPTGGNRLVTAPSGMPAYGLAAPGPSGTAHHHPIKDHRRIYMSAKSRL